jgi:hypothetical protein
MLHSERYIFSHSSEVIVLQDDRFELEIKDCGGGPVGQLARWIIPNYQKAFATVCVPLRNRLCDSLEQIDMRLIFH